MMRFISWLRHTVRSTWFWIITWVVLVVAAASVLSIIYWDWLSIRESNGSTIRNIILAAAAVIALPLALWRSKVAERQSETAQRGLLNERYQKAAEMLGSEKLSVRLGGIYTLARLAREHPGSYHTQIMSLLCAFVHHPPVVENQNPEQDDDFGGIIKAIIARSAKQIEIEKEEQYRLDLREVNLPFARILKSAELANADLMSANLSHAHLGEANLDNANLTRANLENCKGLTQEQIDRATADSENPPKLEGVVDVNTGRPLVWRGKPLDAGE